MLSVVTLRQSKYSPAIRGELHLSSEVTEMWTKSLSVVGAIAGFVLSHPFFFSNFIPFRVLIIGLPLVLGCVGFVVGIMLDARKVYWKGVFGILGMPIGVVVGYELARRMAPPSRIAGSEAIAGIVFGAPSGAILGCVSGLLLGALCDKWSNQSR